MLLVAGPVDLLIPRLEGSAQPDQRSIDGAPDGDPFACQAQASAETIASRPGA